MVNSSGPLPGLARFNFEPLTFFLHCTPSHVNSCDTNVTIVTEFPFTGGHSSGFRDPLVRDADSFPPLHFLSYPEVFILDECTAYVVGDSQISKCTDRWMFRRGPGMLHDRGKADVPQSQHPDHQIRWGQPAKRCGGSEHGRNFGRSVGDFGCPWEILGVRGRSWVSVGDLGCPWEVIRGKFWVFRGRF